MHAEVQWFTRGKSLSILGNELLVILQNKIVEAPNSKGINWTIRFAYFFDIIDGFNYLNTHVSKECNLLIMANERIFADFYDIFHNL